MPPNHAVRRSNRFGSLLARYMQYASTVPTCQYAAPRRNSDYGNAHTAMSRAPRRTSGTAAPLSSRRTQHRHAHEAASSKPVRQARRLVARRNMLPYLTRPSAPPMHVRAPVVPVASRWPWIGIYHAHVMAVRRNGVEAGQHDTARQQRPMHEPEYVVCFTVPEYRRVECQRVWYGHIHSAYAIP
jgi:hypothetical protein